MLITSIATAPAHLGDITELNAIATVFGGAKQTPPISSTKSMTGHSLGAVGTQELIYCSAYDEP